MCHVRGEQEGPQARFSYRGDCCPSRLACTYTITRVIDSDSASLRVEVRLGLVELLEGNGVLLLQRCLRIIRLEGNGALPIQRGLRTSRLLGLFRFGCDK